MRTEKTIGISAFHGIQKVTSLEVRYRIIQIRSMSERDQFKEGEDGLEVQERGIIRIIVEPQ